MTNETNRTKVERKSERELVITRTFAAPASVVFDAWTQPARLKAWWSPKSMGLSLVECDVDLRAGGSYRFVIGREGPEAGKMTFHGRYTEVLPRARLVWTNEESSDGSVTTVTFEEKDGATKVVMSEIYPSKAALDESIEGMDAGMTESFTQLDTLLQA